MKRNLLVGFFLILIVVGCSNTMFATNFIQGVHEEINYSIDKDQVMVNNVYCFKMKGSSMNPTLFEGNIVCFRNYTGRETLKQGNMVHYRTDELESLHRIEAVQPDVLVVRGDNNNQEEIINYSQVKGILVLTLYK